MRTALWMLALYAVIATAAYAANTAATLPAMVARDLKAIANTCSELGGMQPARDFARESFCDRALV